MSWKAEHHKLYEARVVADAITRLTTRFDIAALPFTSEELQTLATLAREFFRAHGSAEKQQRLFDRNPFDYDQCEQPERFQRIYVDHSFGSLGK